MNLLDLSGQLILLSGGCGALGLPIVRCLSEHSAHIIVVDIISIDEAQKRFQQESIAAEAVTYIQADITDRTAIARLFEDLDAMPNVVCCHAGMTKAAAIQNYASEDFERLMNLNVQAAFILAQTASKRWLAAGLPGHLIFTTSWVQDVPWPEIAPYNASKAALKMLMKGFARELAPQGIRANAVAPGIVAAGMALKQLETEPDYKQRAEKAIPLGYLQSPESVAHAFLFLCSPMASYMTGSVLLVDGGASLYPMDD